MYTLERRAFSLIAPQRPGEQQHWIVRHAIAHAIQAYLITDHASSHKPSGSEYNAHESEIWADQFTASMEKAFGTRCMTFIHDPMNKLLPGVDYGSGGASLTVGWVPEAGDIR